MEVSLAIIAILVVIALCFDFTNGFHDSANAIATVVATKAMTMESALLMAALCNLVGAFIATKVAETIQSGLLKDVGDPLTSQLVVIAALLAAISWNLVTWWVGLPSSSSHAIVGGLVGAGLVYGHRSNIIWTGVVDKVVIPMMTSPFVAAAIAGVMSLIVIAITKPLKQDTQESLFRRLQIFSAATMAFSHGSNDAQKTMGVITLALVAGHFLPPESGIPFWVIVACAVAIAAGTFAGGRKIIITAGEKITKLDQQSGFVANICGSITVLAASFLGMPVSTTHVVVGSITGAGYVSYQAQDVDSVDNPPAVNWQTWRRMALAWLLTLPGAALVGGFMFWLLRLFFLTNP